MKYIFCDSSALMQSPERVDNLLKKENAKAIVCSIVLDELDKHKDFGDNERNYKARQAFKLIKKLKEEDKIMIAIREEVMLPKQFDMKIPDNKILACINALIKETPMFDIKLLTYDNGMKAKAHLLGIPVIEMEEEEEEDNYKGYIEIYGTEEEIDEQLLALEESKILKINQYVIMYQKEEDQDTYETYTCKWNGTELVDTIVPNKKYPIKPLNGPQACAIDLMCDKNVPIKIIAGGYGAGKTMIAVKAAEEMVVQGIYNKLMLVRNPVPADDIDIGALPGSKHDKVGSYFKSMTQYLTDYSNGLEGIDSFDPDNEFAAKQRGYELIMEIPSFMKGMSVNDTIMIVDECEDLNLKLIKMLGTRIGKGSCIVFTGDYHQAEKKYKVDSGISRVIEQMKGDPLVGIVVLEEDVRSSVSKLFSNLK